MDPVLSDKSEGSGGVHSLLFEGCSGDSRRRPAVYGASINLAGAIQFLRLERLSGSYEDSASIRELGGKNEKEKST